MHPGDEGHMPEKKGLSHVRKALLAFLALCSVIFLIYGNSLHCAWQLDDRPNITENPHIHLKEFSWEGIRGSFFSDLRDPGVLYRPVAGLSFALNYYFGGLNVTGYHVVNILIHLGAAFFLFLFIYHTLRLPLLASRYKHMAYRVALLGALFWAVNPVQVQSVTYIVQRMASLAGMFYVLTMYLYLKARITRRGTRLTFFLLASVSFMLALGSKENAVILPVTLFLYELMLLKGFQNATRGRHRKKILLFSGFALALFLMFLGYRGEELFSLIREGYTGRPFTLAQRLLTEPRVIVLYASLLLYPVPSRLNIAHSMAVSTSPFDPPSTLFALVFVLASITFLILRARKYPLFSFCYLFFFLNHIIESSVLPLELVFEHRNYIPSMLFFAPIAAGLGRLLERFRNKMGVRVAVSVVVMGALIGLGYGTFVRNFDWQDPKTLWTDAARKSPDQFRVHHNLGVYYHDHGCLEKALSAYKKALESPGIQKRDEKIITYYNLGRLYEARNDPERAISFYKEALRLDPDFYYALGNLGAVYGKEGNQKLAGHYLREAVHANPHDPHINFNMGLLCLKRGRPEEAILYLEKALDHEGLKKRALLYLGVAFKEADRLDQAAVCFKALTRMDPKNLTPRLHLAVVYLRTGSKAQAHEQVEEIADIIIRRPGLFKDVEALISKTGYWEEESSACLLGHLRKALEDREEESGKRNGKINGH